MSAEGRAIGRPSGPENRHPEIRARSSSLLPSAITIQLMSYVDLLKQREYQRDWLRRNRNAWVSANGPCVDCGSTEDLQVDHVDRSLKVTHRVWSWALPRRLAELAKCVVRCKVCHLRKSREVGDLSHPSAQHGTEWMYRSRKCRCELCVAAYKAIRRAHYERTGN
jgi:hypothetical protein